MNATSIHHKNIADLWEVLHYCTNSKVILYAKFQFTKATNNHYEIIITLYCYNCKETE